MLGFFVDIKTACIFCASRFALKLTESFGEFGKVRNVVVLRRSNYVFQKNNYFNLNAFIDLFHYSFPLYATQITA